MLRPHPIESGFTERSRKAKTTAASHGQNKEKNVWEDNLRSQAKPLPSRSLKSTSETPKTTFSVLQKRTEVKRGLKNSNEKPQVSAKSAEIIKQGNKRRSPNIIKNNDPNSHKVHFGERVEMIQSNQKNSEQHILQGSSATNQCALPTENILNRHKESDNFNDFGRISVDSLEQQTSNISASLEKQKQNGSYQQNGAIIKDGPVWREYLIPVFKGIWENVILRDGEQQLKDKTRKLNKPDPVFTLTPDMPFSPIEEEIEKHSPEEFQNTGTSTEIIDKPSENKNNILIEEREEQPKDKIMKPTEEAAQVINKEKIDDNHENILENQILFKDEELKPTEIISEEILPETERTKKAEINEKIEYPNVVDNGVVMEEELKITKETNEKPKEEPKGIESTEIHSTEDTPIFEEQSNIGEANVMSENSLKEESKNEAEIFNDSPEDKIPETSGATVNIIEKLEKNEKERSLENPSEEITEDTMEEIKEITQILTEISIKKTKEKDSALAEIHLENNIIQALKGGAKYFHENGMGIQNLKQEGESSEISVEELQKISEQMDTITEREKEEIIEQHIALEGKHLSEETEAIYFEKSELRRDDSPDLLECASRLTDEIMKKIEEDLLHNENIPLITVEFDGFDEHRDNIEKHLETPKISFEQKQPSEKVPVNKESSLTDENGNKLINERNIDFRDKASSSVGKQQEIHKNLDEPESIKERLEGNIEKPKENIKNEKTEELINFPDKQVNPDKEMLEEHDITSKESPTIESPEQGKETTAESTEYSRISLEACASVGSMERKSEERDDNPSSPSSDHQPIGNGHEHLQQGQSKRYNGGNGRPHQRGRGTFKAFWSNEGYDQGDSYSNAPGGQQQQQQQGSRHKKRRRRPNKGYNNSSQGQPQ